MQGSCARLPATANATTPSALSSHQQEITIVELPSQSTSSGYNHSTSSNSCCKERGGEEEDLVCGGESDIESGNTIPVTNSSGSSFSSNSSSALSAWFQNRSNNQHDPNNNNNNNNNSLPQGLAFRRIRPSDRPQIQQLHEEWFPVSYQDDFYDSLVHGRMVGTDEALVTLLIVEKDHEKDNKIVAALVGSWVALHTLSAATRTALLVPTTHRVYSYNNNSSDQSPQQQFFYIMTLGCRPEYRGQGLATLLLRACIHECQGTTAAGGLYLHVWTENVVAIRMYERLNFQRRQYIPNYYRIQGEPHACYLYALCLEEQSNAADGAGHYYYWRRRFQRMAQHLWWGVIQAATMVEHGWRHYSYYWYARRRRRQWTPPYLDQGRRRSSIRRADDGNNNNGHYSEPSNLTKNHADVEDETALTSNHGCSCSITTTISSCGSSSSTTSSLSSTDTFTPSSTTNTYATSARRRERWDCP